MPISKHISTLGFVGYMPFAPGTFGTLAGVIFIVLLKPALFFHVVLTIFFIVAGVISAGHAEKLFGCKDPSQIVIDEFAGYLASLLFLPLRWEYILSAFILFRIFDIIKPPPLKKIETLPGSGLAVMADDIGAAIYTNLLLQAWRFLI